MSLRKAFFTNSIVLLLCMVFVVFAGLEPVKSEEKKKSELAELMGKIDAYSKVLDRLATYFSFDEAEKEQKVHDDACANLVSLSKTTTTKFARPDDAKYQEINQAMLTSPENLAAVFKDASRNNSLEDVIWQAGQLRQTCAACHKHLDIHIGSDKRGIELLFLPSYSPHLNLIEWLWRFTRKECLYSKYYPKFDGFKQAIADCIQNAHLKHRDKLETLLTWNFQSFEKVKISTV